MEEIRENKKGFKKTEIGYIPDDWKVASLKEVALVITGSTPPTKDIENYNGEFCFVSPADINNSKYIYSTNKTLTLKGFNISRKLPKHSILFTCIGSTIGKIAIATKEMTCNQQINALIVNEFNNSEFIYYQLDSLAPKIKLIAGEQAVPLINKTDFQSVKVILPPLPEQQKIASILSKWDELIETQTQLIEEKEKQKKGLMQKLFPQENEKVPKYRFKEFIKDGNWEIDIVDNLVLTITPPRKLNSSNYQKEGEFPIIDQSKSFYCGWTNDVEAIITDNLPLIIFGDHTCILKMAKEPFAQGADGIKILKTKTKVLPEFLYQYLQHNEVKLEDYKRHFSILKEKKVLFPKKENGEQQKIISIFSAIDEEIQFLKDELEAIKLQKKGLMQQLLTGKIRVKI